MTSESKQPLSKNAQAMDESKAVPVYLNVYDLHPANKYVHRVRGGVPLFRGSESPFGCVSLKIGMGAYHSGLQIFGREWTFGYLDSDHTGIFDHHPRCCLFMTCFGLALLRSHPCIDVSQGDF